MPSDDKNFEQPIPSSSDIGLEVEQKPTASPPEPEKPASVLAARLREVKLRAKGHVEKAVKLFELRTAETETVPVTEIPKPEEVFAQLKELAESPVTDGPEFIAKSRQVLSASSRLSEQTTHERDELEEKIILLQREQYRNKDKKDELEQKKGLRGIASFFEKKRVSKRGIQIQAEIDQLRPQSASRWDLSKQIRDREYPVKQKMEEVVFDEIGHEVREIKSEYQGLLEEILKDGTITQEIREKYISSTLSPEVDRIIREQNLPPEQKGIFFDALNSYANHLEDPDPERKPYREEFQRVMNEPGFWEVRRLSEELLVGNDKDVVMSLVANLAYETAMEVKGSIAAQLDSFGQRDKLDRTLMIAFEQKDKVWWNPEKTLGKKVSDRMNKYAPWSHPQMDFWLAAKSSKTAREIFGEEIQKQDREIYTKALDESLTDFDGKYIDLLLYYPTPDAIRNLVIIAAADAREYRTVHANRLFCEFSKFPDWNNQLTEAIKEYPLLASTRPLLETWDFSLHHNHNEIRGKAKEMVLDVIRQNPENKKLIKLAIESLSNKDIVNVLIEIGVSKSSLDSILEANDFLEKTPHFEDYHFLTTLREELKVAASPDSNVPVQKLNESLIRLNTLSAEIIKNKEKHHVLNYLLSKEVVDTLVKIKVNPEYIFKFPENATALMGEKFKETRAFIFLNSDVLLRDLADIKFLNNLAGEFGQKSDPLIRGYLECLKSDVLVTTERDLILEFARQFRVVSPVTIQGYKEAKRGGYEKVYIADLRTLAEKMTGSTAITEEERSKPYYKDLLKHVYSNNSGQWGSHEANESCGDRSGDLEVFKITPRYEIDLLSQSEIRVKSGETLDPEAKEAVQKPILVVAQRMGELGHDKEKIHAELEERINKMVKDIKDKGGLQEINLDDITTLDQRLFLILADSNYGTRTVGPNEIKDLMITYEFSVFEDISDYISGTSDRVSRASNQDYALLCEVGSFYSDRIKEVNRNLVQSALVNPKIAEVMPVYFRKLASEATSAQRKDQMNRLQINKLGTSDSFVAQISKILEKKNKRKYSPDQVRRIIYRYENWTEGLSENPTSSQAQETKAFYGLLRSQRERTFSALKMLSGQEVDPKQTHLGEIDIEQVLSTETNIQESKYDEAQFASYTAQRFIDIFESEKMKVEKELSKFESLTGKQKETLYAYITKGKESANARMVGGVCVSVDNPGKYPEQNMWDMPNYFQMVFQEPDTMQCQGLVLLHHFDEDGKKILTASINPSSTYLYSVDETALFNGISAKLEQFASENNFDMLVVSNTKAIRTNRTGGEFEKAMDRKIATKNKKLKFTSPKQFSFHPVYRLEEMDVLWEKETQ